MALFFHSTASLVMAECACTSLIITSFIDVPSLVSVDPRYLNCLKYFKRLKCLNLTMLENQILWRPHQDLQAFDRKRKYKLLQVFRKDINGSNLRGHDKKYLKDDEDMKYKELSQPKSR